MSAVTIPQATLRKLVFEQNLAVGEHVLGLSVNAKRDIYKAIRQLPEDAKNVLLVRAGGVTLGEFSTMDALIGSNNKHTFKHGLDGLRMNQKIN